MEHWYAVFTKPRQEATAFEHLTRQGFATFLPKVQTARRRGARFVDTIEPLFPRYLFVRADFDRHSVAPIRSTRGVTGIVRTGLEPAQVPDAVIDSIRTRMNPDTGLCRIEPPGLARGDAVSIAEGAFEGLHGVFEMQDGADRATVLLHLLGGVRAVTVPAVCVVPRETAAYRRVG